MSWEHILEQTFLIGLFAATRGGAALFSHVVGVAFNTPPTRGRRSWPPPTPRTRNHGPGRLSQAFTVKGRVLVYTMLFSARQSPAAVRLSDLDADLLEPRGNRCTIALEF